MRSQKNPKCSFFSDVGYDVEDLPNYFNFNFKVIHWSTIFGENSNFNKKDFSNPKWKNKEVVHLLKSKTPFLESGISINNEDYVFKKRCHFYHHAALIFSIWKMILEINDPNGKIPPHIKEAFETYYKNKKTTREISDTKLKKNAETMFKKLINHINLLFYFPLLEIIKNETSTIPEDQNILIVLDNLNPIDEISQLFESLEKKTLKEFPDIEFFYPTNNFAIIKNIIQEDIHNFLQSRELQNKKANSFLFLHSLLVNRAHNPEAFQLQQDFLITNYDSILFYLQINFFWMSQYVIKLQKMSFNSNNINNNDNQNNENTDNNDDNNNDSNINGNNNDPPNGNNNSGPDNDNNNSGENHDNQPFDTESQLRSTSKKRKKTNMATLFWNDIKSFTFDIKSLRSDIQSIKFHIKLLYILVIMIIVFVIYMSCQTQTNDNRSPSVNTQQSIYTSPSMTKEELYSRSMGFGSKGLPIPRANLKSDSFFSSSPLFNYFFKKEFL